MCDCIRGIYDIEGIGVGWAFGSISCQAGQEAAEMADNEEVVEPLHLELEDREVYLAKIPVRCASCGLVCTL